MLAEEKEYKDIEINEETIENMQFIDCIFHNCSFRENHIKNCLFQNCSFIHCNIINNSFLYTLATNNRLDNSTVLGMNWTYLMKKGKAFLPFLTIKKCTLKYNNFHLMNLKKFDFSRCDLSGSFFEECNLEGSIFRYSILKNVYFGKNNLTRADFRNAEEYQIDITDNRMKKAKFSFPDAIRLLESIGIEID